MTTIEIGNKRLLQLAEHLETGNLGHERFDFSEWNINGYDEDGNAIPPNASCGTIGCALGECPILWPTDWRFDSSGIPVYNYCDGTNESIEKWFMIGSLGEAWHLFRPNEQQPSKYGGVNLLGNATKEEVAANIRAFVALRQS